MSARPIAAALAVALTLSLAPLSARAITVDGQLDPAYGTALVTQTNQTSLGGGQISGDSNTGDLSFSNGSELDGAFAEVSDGVLHLFLAGNLALMLNANQNGTVGHILDVFVDSAPGGLNALSGLGAGHPLNGLTFDTGFEADYLLEFQGDGDRFSTWWTARYAAFTGGMGSPPTTLGIGTAGGPGTLTGGTNPHGILVTINNQNTGGVTLGCGASSGAGVSTGIEWAIPLAAIGSPVDCFRVSVIVRDAGGSQSPVSNQVLAPVPVGTCPLGAAQSVNFAGIAGDQFFDICPSATGVAPAAPAGFALALEGAPPVRGESLRLAFALPDARPATVRLYDCAGRLVRERDVRLAAAGFGTVDLSEGSRLAPGLYWARLVQGGRQVTRKVCLLR